MKSIDFDFQLIQQSELSYYCTYITVVRGQSNDPVIPLNSKKHIHMLLHHLHFT